MSINSHRTFHFSACADHLRKSALVLICALLAALTFAGQSGGRRDNRDADRAAIRACIEEITQAYLDGDTEKIYVDRTDDWTGFLGRTSTPVIGRDQYMKVQGLRYPVPAEAAASKPVKDTSTIFRITDFDVNFVSPDVGVANLILEYAKRGNSDFVPTARMRITDVYVKRKDVWVQAASHTSSDPNWRPASN